MAHHAQANEQGNMLIREDPNAIRRADLEGSFTEMVRTLQPTDSLMKIVGMVFKDAWEQLLDRANDILAQFQHKWTPVMLFGNAPKEKVGSVRATPSSPEPI